MMIKLGMMEPAHPALETVVTFEAYKDLLRGAKELAWANEQAAYLSRLSTSEV